LFGTERDVTVTVPKRTNRLGIVLPGFLAVGTVLLVCLAPETPQDPVTQSDVAALTRIHDCDRFGVPAGTPSWSATAIDDDPDSPDDDDDDSPDRDGPDAIIASPSSVTEIGAQSTLVDQTDAVAVYVAEFDVHGLRGPPARLALDQCHGHWPADGSRWSAPFKDDSPDSTDDDDDDDDDDGPDALIAQSPSCTDSARHCSSDLSHASSDPIQHASENHSLRAPPQ
jgi:hypothetical protein